MRCGGHGRRGRRLTCLVSLFHSVQNLSSDLSTSRLGILRRVVLSRTFIGGGDRTSHLERNGLVGLCGEEEVLPSLVGGLHSLLVGGHESVPGNDPFRDLGVVDLEEESLLPTGRITFLRHLVAG